MDTQEEIKVLNNLYEDYKKDPSDDLKEKIRREVKAIVVMNYFEDKPELFEKMAEIFIGKGIKDLI